MTAPDAPVDRAAVVGLIRRLAQAQKVRIEARVQQSLYELDLDATDILACLRSVTETEVHKDEPDQNRPDKRVFVFHTPYADRVLYVKVSIRIPKDHDLCVLSFKAK